MSGKQQALYSTYVIDGLQQESTPAALLDGLKCNRKAKLSIDNTIVDESADPQVRAYDYDSGEVADYLSLIADIKDSFPLAYSGAVTRSTIANALIDSLWREGHFRLGNLSLKLAWTWDERPVGAMAAFYESVRNAVDYVDDLGLSLMDYDYLPAQGACRFDVTPVLLEATLDDGDEYAPDPFSISHAEMGNGRVIASNFVPDTRSWVIYVPFDTCDYRLGGSRLAQALGLGGAAPSVMDADYFIDCYEIVREFVEDGVVLSATTVGKGGLIAAVDSMCVDMGIEINITDILKSCQDKSKIRALFAELPGALIQIQDCEFDYLDAEMLLQDVAYFPLGHPSKEFTGVKVNDTEKTGIQTIIESLMQNAEGED